MRGKFITLEGGEGCGKTTHAARLTERLQARGMEVVRVREPGGTELCERVRAILKGAADCEEPGDRAETLLFLAARAQLVAQVIRPALERGAWVVSDRFSDSTLAYQGYGRGLPLEMIRAINAFATEDLTPDVTLLLEVPDDVAAARLGARGETDRIEQAGAEFHARLKQGFRALAAAEPARFRVIDSSGTFEATAAKIDEAVCI